LEKVTLLAGLTTPFTATEPDWNQLANCAAVTVQVAFASEGMVCALTDDVPTTDNTKRRKKKMKREHPEGRSAYAFIVGLLYSAWSEKNDAIALQS
jgi:hypothetical protein